MLLFCLLRLTFQVGNVYMFIAIHPRETSRLRLKSEGADGIILLLICLLDPQFRFSFLSMFRRSKKAKGNEYSDPQSVFLYSSNNRVTVCAILLGIKQTVSMPST
mmetsp:Transcript_20644/g.31481  ORF Transcript_20644/g.31481 Transcript_20644/m.31481 type:complete len:105 (+) Transcript_20644:731-1045(+)